MTRSPGREAATVKAGSRADNDRGESQVCFECGRPAEVNHHVVPRSRGGTRTVPLCGLCHGKAHHRDGNMSTRSVTSRSLQHKKAKGELVGSVPYGYQLAADGTHLEPCETEQIIIAKAKSYHAGGMGLREIGRRLSADGYTLRGSSTMHHMTVKRLLAAEAVIGATF